MILYILRHATAEAHTSTDVERRLTHHGREEALAVSKFCSHQQLLPELILTSPVTRARETAELVNEKISREFLEVPWLACGMEPEEGLEQLKAYKKFSSVMIVGHEPDLSRLVALCTGGHSSESFSITKASLTIIQLRSFVPGSAILQALMPVRFLL